MRCLQKGIAYHHAGMIQIFKEMVEHLFEKKYIKLLIATETFAVGVDMPAQSVIFTALQKYNGQKIQVVRTSRMFSAERKSWETRTEQKN